MRATVLLRFEDDHSPGSSGDEDLDLREAGTCGNGILTCDSLQMPDVRNSGLKDTIRTGYFINRYRGSAIANTYPFDEDLLQRLPLPTASFFVLFALAEEEKHGYHVMQDIREVSEGTFTIGPATLYTTIKTLTEQGFISETSSSTDDRRRTYALTATGKRLLGAEFHRQ